MISKEWSEFIARQMTPANQKKREEEAEKKSPSLDGKIREVKLK